MMRTVQSMRFNSTISLFFICAGFLSAQSPNIVVVMPDDLNRPLMNAALAAGMMPNVQNYIINPGTTFDRYYVSNSHGCPTREAYFTGQYFKNHLLAGYGTKCSVYQAGGVTPLATLMTGFRRALIGKYADGYGYEDVNRDGVVDIKDAEYCPPGWEGCYIIPFYQAQVNGTVPPNNGILAQDNPNDYQYYFNQNGTLSYHGTTPQDYQATVLANASVQFIQGSIAKAPQNPLLMFLTYGAPHVEPNYNPDPLPDYANIYAFTVHPPPGSSPTTDTSYLQDPTFNAVSVAGKPAYVTNLAFMNAADLSAIQIQWQNRLEALAGVDVAFGQTVQALQAAGQLQNTIFIFLSDNGWMDGDFRLGGKLAPYDPSIQTPLYVSVGGGVVSHAQIGDNDVMPTILQMAGKPIPSNVDGTSFVPLLQNPTLPWRKRYFVQYIQDGLGIYDITSYNGVRTSLTDTISPDTLYTEYKTRETELYHYQTDPYAQQNLNMTPAWASQMKQLQNLITRWLTCTGVACHNLEFN
jgi:N-acetylglucosamine-6-sulfatase